MQPWQTDADTSLAGLRRNNKCITPVAFRNFSRLPDGNWLALQETIKFDKDDWNMKLDRRILFNHLLSERNLIGMDKNELISILGVEQQGSDWLFYDITSPNVTCGNAMEGLLI